MKRSNFKSYIDNVDIDANFLTYLLQVIRKYMQAYLKASVILHLHVGVYNGGVSELLRLY